VHISTGKNACSAVQSRKLQAVIFVGKEGRSLRIAINLSYSKTVAYYYNKEPLKSTYQKEFRIFMNEYQLCIFRAAYKDRE
jgi:hypothetical protein